MKADLLEADCVKTIFHNWSRRIEEMFKAKGDTGYNAFQMKVEVLDLGLMARAQAKRSPECQILDRRGKTRVEDCNCGRGSP
jgi:hypothetical protein